MLKCDFTFCYSTKRRRSLRGLLDFLRRFSFYTVWSDANTGIREYVHEFTQRCIQYKCTKLLHLSRMSPAKDSATIFLRTRKQRKRFKRRVKVKARTRARKSEKLKEKENVTPLVKKYWLQRYDLFSKYDMGIKLDEEGWFSVTPEEIAVRQAWRCPSAGVVIDAFAGVGGNAIQFAKACNHVVAIDIDPNKVALALHNAKIYGVEDYIDFIVGDFFQLAPFLKGGVVFLSPPWGGPSYKAREIFTLDLLKPKDGCSLFQVAQAITPNIIMFLPRNIDMLQASELSWLSSPPLKVEIEENFVGGHSKGVTVYFGDIAFP